MKELHGYRREGVFYIPKDVNLKDLGGKASRLIETQDIVRKNNFEMPVAVALPWQTFLETTKSSGNKAGKIISLDNCVKPIMQSGKDVRKAVIDCMRVIQNPFYSSSAQGEDSESSRMAGVYKSKMAKYENTDSIKEKIWRNLDAIEEVLVSYFEPLPTILRNKHKIAHTGMSVLVRETVGDQTGPDGSMVLQMIAPELANLTITWGFGERIVDGGNGQQFQYDFLKNKLLNQLGKPLGSDETAYHEDSFQEYFPSGLKGLEALIHKIRKLDTELTHPEGFGGDYEIAFVKDRFYLLQNPNLRYLKPIDVPIDRNILSRVDQVAGADSIKFKKIVFVPEFDSPRDKEAIELFNFNIENSDYLIVTEGMARNAEIFCNCSGILETFKTMGSRKFRESGRMHRGGNNVVAHYETLLRSECIGIVEAEYTKILGNLNKEAKQYGNLKVLEINGEFRYNQFNKTAGIYLS